MNWIFNAACVAILLIPTSKDAWSQNSFSGHINNKKITQIDSYQVKYQVAENGQKFLLVNRDTKHPVNIFPGKIKQDNILVGNYTVTNNSWQGKIIKTFSFYLPNGTKAAEAYIIGISQDDCQLTTFHDNKTQQIEIKAIENSARVKIIAQFLIEQGYM